MGGHFQHLFMLASFVMQAPGELARPFWEAHNRAVQACGNTWERRLDAAYGRFVFDHDLAGAEREMLQLQRERPHSAHVYIRLAMVYLAAQRLDEAGSLLPPRRRRRAATAVSIYRSALAPFSP